MTKIQKIVAYLTATSLILGGMTAAWSSISNIVVTANEVQPLFEDLLSRKEVELANLEITVYNAQQKGQKIPKHIIESIVRLKAEIKKLKKKKN